MINFAADYDRRAASCFEGTNGGYGNPTGHAMRNEPGRRVWTIAEIKAELPSVPVRMTDMGTEYTGALAGRKCPFPQVTITIKGTHVHLEAAWETVQHVLNVGT